MKIILSRKGFDSAAGKVASPILPDGELCSLPIPTEGAHKPSIRYANIMAGDVPLGRLVSDLTRCRISPEHTAHLDPDLRYTSYPREPGWKPIFGQDAAAESHLRRQGVAEGDIFLFFGWFRQTELVNGRYRYVANAPDCHYIFGWLQIERRIAVTNRAELPSWALYHPHCSREQHSKLDSLYVSTGRLQLPGWEGNLPGGGVFTRVDDTLRLTCPGSLRSTWQLPGWFYSADKAPTLSYHTNPRRWTRQGDHALLSTVGRGQEFVLDCEDYPEAVEWAAGILKRGAAVGNG
ncbi:MAG: hypothetical protein M3441_05120 [Chloroflexota bacterium]|nr:hypothetical protein [Chloroflexota bacterium]